jgi:uncharacterized paraquat-inducible protein A
MDPKLVWPAIIVLVLLHVFISARMAFIAGQLGRSRLRWFLLTLFLTAIPASIVLRRVRDELLAKQAAAGEEEPPAVPKGFLRCPHCRRLIQPKELDAAAPVRTCPRCGLRMEEDASA